MAEPTFWQPLTPYSLGTRVVDNNGAFQQATVGGTSGASAPAWNTAFGGTTNDAAPLVWTLVGYWMAKFARPHSPGPYDEALVDAIAISTGSVDAGKVILANANGQLDNSFSAGGGSLSFADLTTGDNTTATMTVDTGATLTYANNGVINASEWAGTPIIGSPTLGKIPIGQGTTAAWADPLVQGVYPPTTRTDIGGISGGPINPVLIGGSDYAGSPELRDLKVDSSGQIYIGNSSLAVTQSTSPWVVSGNLTNNNAAPSTNNLGVLVALANATHPTYTEGDQVLLSTDLTGALRVNVIAVVADSVTQGTTPWIVAGGGTAGAAATGVVTVQGVALMTPLLVTATIAASQTIAVTNAGTFAVQDSAAEGSLAEIALDTDNLPTILTELGTIDTDLKSNITLHAGANIIGKVSQDTSPWVVSLASTSVDYSQDSARFSRAQVNISSATTTHVVTAVGGQTIRVYRMLLIFGQGTAMNLTIQDTNPTVLFPMTLFGGGSSLGMRLDAEPWFTTGVGKGFDFVTDQATALTGLVFYTQG